MEPASSFPVYDLDTDIVKITFGKVGPALDDRKYEQAIGFASTTLGKIQEFLIVTLDHRSYAHGKQARFEEAEKDAQDMITYQPTVANGYLRLGNIYQMQGKQRSAIDVYNNALQKVSTDHPHYTQIINSKERATRQNETRIDFVAKFPVELVGEVVMLLPENSKSAFWSVCSEWRIKISKCPTIWEKMTSGDGTKTDWTTSVMPHIAIHVKDLTINTKNRGVFLHYLRAMKDGKFRKLKSLKMNENATKHINTEATLFSKAISMVYTTLTRLVLHLNELYPAVSLTALLSTCSSLKSIEYSTPTYLSHAIGEFAPPSFRSSLVDIELKAKSIIQQDLVKLRPFCQQVRRLLLYGCHTSVLDAVNTICPNLETFGYDPLGTVIPALTPSDAQGSYPGIRRLYTKNGGSAEPASAFLPLIRRNMLSLKELHTNISIPNENLLSSIPVIFEDLELRNLERLTLWGHGEVVMPLISRSISTCTALAHIEIVVAKDISAFVDTLVALPQLETFGLSDDLWSMRNEEDLVRLFDTYATDSKSERRLRNCWLRRSSHIVTNNVLSALAGIATLEDVTFERLSNISAAVMNSFFEKRGNSLSRVKLVEIGQLDDDHLLYDSLRIIGRHSSNLKSVHLEKLGKMTDQGIIELVDQAPKLQNLTIVECKYITENAITHAKSKVENVVYNQ